MLLQSRSASVVYEADFTNDDAANAETVLK